MKTSSDSKSAPAPDYSFEQTALSRGYETVAGIDEAGRGPWAGPVVAAAVVLDPIQVPDGLNDSKKLTARAREQLFDAIMAQADVGVGIADVARIDRDNILAATLWAMAEALDGLACSPDFALIDGNRMPALPCAGETVVKGDGRSVSIAAASIIAKTTRDRLMGRLGAEFPGYGWERNMGYGTREHSGAIERLGVTPHHRRSFRPIRLALGLED